jgi:trehalose/maltose hydrolase-like predicted phosphorylase
LAGEQEHHISADVAYAVWQYWRATADDNFIVDAGADILVETARFWASRARIEVDDHAHISAVIGLDEYHETVDDNGNLDRAADAVAKATHRLEAAIGLSRRPIAGGLAAHRRRTRDGLPP